VALFRAGNDDAFRAIHDRYRQRLFAYTRQMLPRRQDAEDALQDVFVRAYAGLRANDREVALRAWLYRVAHNRCVDELRRPLLPPAEVFELITVPQQDPVAQADQRESLRRLIADVRRLPEQQRSALLMRELSGMSYAELAEALETTVPAVKSLLVRARLALALALEARDTSCTEIREEIVLAQDRRTRPNATARRHMRDCAGCREFRHELRGVSVQLRALAPAVGPLGGAAKLLGFGFGGGAGGGAAMGGGTAAAGSVGSVGGVSAGAVGTGGALASASALAAGAGHVATLLVATVVTAGGAVEIQRTIAPVPAHHHHARHAKAHARAASAQSAPASVLPAGYVVSAPVPTVVASVAPAVVPVYHPALSAPPAVAPAPPAKPAAASHPAKTSKAAKAGAGKTASTGTTTGEGSSSTGSTADSAPVISGTAVTDGSSGTGASGTSSTAAGTTPGDAAGASGSTNSTATASPGSAGGSGSTSTGTSGTTSPDASAGSSGPAPSPQ
jgi:RNA polymerase sigma factor (sigma-70 family)